MKTSTLSIMKHLGVRRSTVGRSSVRNTSSGYSITIHRQPLILEIKRFRLLHQRLADGRREIPYFWPALSCWPAKKYRVRCAHQITPCFYCALFIERHHYTRAARHKLRQTWKEGPLSMNSIKTFRLTTCHMNKFESTDFEITMKDPLNDRSRVSGANSVRFDNSES